MFEIFSRANTAVAEAPGTSVKWGRYGVIPWNKTTVYTFLRLFKRMESL
jgi:hypothetical protein